MTDVGEPTGAGGEKDLIADSGVVGTEAAVVRRMRRRRRRMATNVVLQIFAMIAIGMLVYPQGADWLSGSATTRIFPGMWRGLPIHRAKSARESSRQHTVTTTSCSLGR